MITEDYVSFETAKLLKEKGFDELTYACFSNDGKETYYGYRAVGNDINCPTLQMAMKWLREVHNKTIVPDVRINDPISGTIDCYIVSVWYIPRNSGGAFCYTYPTPYNGYSSYEEACEAAIKYCLEELI